MSQPSSIELTAEGAVIISYRSLKLSPETLGSAIEKAFGSDPGSLGIIVVRDLPDEYVQYRERLLKLAYQFGNLDEATRESYSDEASNYSFGWSHGKEIMNGQPDTLKGSYYANPVADDPTVPLEEKNAFPQYYGKNIWPKKDEKGIENFEDAFKDLSRFIFKVGCELAVACQPFASSHLNDSTISLADLIQNSQTTKARLLHYFPPSPDSPPSSDDDPIDSWCGFHLDHSLLTGLCPAMFIRPNEEGPEVVPAPSPASGLYIRTRGGQLTKVAIPHNCLAFQTGEALEIATNGRLLATPHCVRIGVSKPGNNISRESFALFMQPNTDQLLSKDTTFGAFSKRVFAEHYESTK
ncbi:hypothetical protein HYPSUDRAFT_73807 [Hypholoma sublateritium FD-334 SS-4]|uniref:Uncharacterized protein n=1 Tax=Hypholoma sublateritium (strain FD-334 SS-4) TaxID=945553 RepID=A0A0D2QCG8_HYPSF|nr:hypothetical protein HYPSUDRAFT_73807 [Hypholoma sublateritium FD-334 SS-4]